MAGDITAVEDALGYIRRNPARFFLSGSYQPTELAALIVREALAAGTRDVSTTRIGGWLVVRSEDDWLGDEWEQTFKRIVPFPAAGQNVMRVEVLATAFADRAVTALNGAISVIKGELDEELEAFLQNYGGRVVAFA